jgi:vitamin B12 transporter
MRSYWLLTFAPLILLGADPQITGIVVDPSGRPVPEARVACAGRTVTSGADGRFAVEGPPACDATVTKTGFEKAAIKLALGSDARIALSISPLNEQVVVSATRAPIALEESGVSATVVTQADFSARQFMQVPDVLREVAGLSIVNTSRRGGLTSVFTRGGASTGTLVLLDGVPLNEPGGGMNFAHFSSAGLARMEVVRGPESALFGAEAASGVIELFTERGNPESSRPHLSASYERGSFQTDHWMADVNGGLLNRIDYSFTADQFHSAGEYQNDFYRNTTGSANIGFRFSPATQLRAIFRTYDATVGNPDQVGWGIYNLDASELDRSSTLALKLDDARGTRFYERFQFGYNRLRDTFNDVNAEGPYNLAALVRDVSGPAPRVYLDRLVPFTFPPAQVPAGEQLVTVPGYTLYPYPSFTFTDRKSFDYQGTLTHTGGALVFGYDFDRQGGIISQQTVTRDNNGMFVHEQYSLGRRVFLTGGVRVEHSSTFGSRIAPRGSATFLLLGDHGHLSSTYFRVSAGRGITEPSLLQNFAAESFYVGNPHLKPERTNTYEAGIVQELFGRRIRAEAVAFRNSFSGLIVFDFSNFPGTWNNIDRSWARGVETSVTAKLAKNVTVTSAWTRTDTRITSTVSTNPYNGVGEELPRRPKNSGSVVLQVAPRRWTLVAGGRFVGERQDGDFVFNITRNPAYANAFVSASYNLTKNVTPYLRIDNLTNEKYSEVLGYPALSRNAIGGLRVSW